jgi:hypothetical protein
MNKKIKISNMFNFFVCSYDSGVIFSSKLYWYTVYASLYRNYEKEIFKIKDYKG